MTRSSPGTGIANRITANVMIDPVTGCWSWQRYITPDGYGRLKVDGRVVLAHRAAYEALVGDIPPGQQLDHLCRNRRCVNPAHLEPVTSRENSLRGEGFVAARAAQSECVNGHVFDEANTYRRPDGNRGCRACNRESVATYAARKRAANKGLRA